MRPMSGRRSAAALVLLFILMTAIACEPTLRQETGIVIGVDSPALGRVDSFELVNLEGKRLTFDTSTLQFRPQFPAPHLSEHQLIGDHIVVTYKTDGGRLVVTQLDDV